MSLGILVPIFERGASSFEAFLVDFGGSFIDTRRHLGAILGDTGVV